MSLRKYVVMTSTQYPDGKVEVRRWCRAWTLRGAERHVRQIQTLSMYRMWWPTIMFSHDEDTFVQESTKRNP